MNSDSKKIKDSPVQQRDGIALVELIVSCVVLVTVMTFVTTLSFRINQVWKDLAHHRVAVDELSNQMGVITRLKPAEAQSALDSLQASKLCSQALQQPQLSGEMSEDGLGTRVVLRINWSRPHTATPLEIAGWLKSSSENQAEEGTQ